MQWCRMCSDWRQAYKLEPERREFDAENLRKCLLTQILKRRIRQLLVSRSFGDSSNKIHCLLQLNQQTIREKKKKVLKEF